VRFCANCHGADARGGRVGKGIIDEVDDIDERVREGHGGTDYGARYDFMPSWSTSDLTNADVSSIAAYLQTLGGGDGDGGHHGDGDGGDDDHGDDD
jgi:mono/diheme cytochrome c family protein